MTLTTCTMFNGSVIVALAVLAGATRSVAQEPTARTMVVEPCTGSCDLTFVSEREYGDDTGPGMIEGSGVRGWLDESGRMYLLENVGRSVQVFGPDGAFLARAGRRGSGPGELEDGSSLVITEDGVFSVLDRVRQVILTFDATGAFRSESRIRGWAARGLETVHAGGVLAVHHADLRTPDLVGYPLHLVNLESGEVVESFGSLTGEYDVRSGFLHVIAGGTGRSVWMAERYAYSIELWEPGRLLRSLRREAKWFPGVAVAELARSSEEEKPIPVIYGIAAGDSLLWVAILTPDERGGEGGEQRNGNPLYDMTLEVIDFRRNRVVGSERLGGVHHLVEPGLLGRLVVTPEGSVRYRTTRVLLGGEVSGREAAAAGGPTSLGR